MDKLRSGFMGAYHSKIVHVPLYKFPPEGRENGWFIDMYLRTYMGIHGLKRVHGVRSDDLFVLLDADEIPTREVLMFLKLYDGYPEPVRLAMRWSVFGFFWKRKRGKQTGSIFNWILDVVKEDDNNAEDLLEVTAVNHHDCFKTFFKSSTETSALCDAGEHNESGVESLSKQHISHSQRHDQQCRFPGEAKSVPHRRY